MSGGRPQSRKGKKRGRDGVTMGDPERVPQTPPVATGDAERVPPVATGGAERVPHAPPALRPGWTVPHPEELPRPTFWPASLAFAVTFLLWGIVTSPIITVVGGILFGVSLAGWIGDIRHESGH